ncbi:MAG: hypothetical protein ACXVY5_00370 [Gaiellales bacterium]
MLPMIAALPLSACAASSASQETVPPAQVEHVKGTGLSRLVLTADAIRRLDLATAPVRVETIHRTRVVGGEVVAAPPASAVATLVTGGVWVRTLLDPGDVRQLDRARPAQVEALVAGAVGAPARAVPGRAGHDPRVVYYRLEGPGRGLTVGQRVRVRLPLTGGGPQKVIPYPAVIYGVDGTAWTYTNPEPRTFIRARIQVDSIEGNRAVLSDGPPEGTMVVTVGGEELFGAEFEFEGE